MNTRAAFLLCATLSSFNIMDFPFNYRLYLFLFYSLMDLHFLIWLYLYNCFSSMNVQISVVSVKHIKTALQDVVESAFSVFQAAVDHNRVRLQWQLRCLQGIWCPWIIDSMWLIVFLWTRPCALCDEWPTGMTAASFRSVYMITWRVTLDRVTMSKERQWKTQGKWMD